MLSRLIKMPFLGRMLTLLVEYKTMMVPLGGSDWYGQQQLGAEIIGAKVIEVNLEALDARRRGHYAASEFFIWEQHANEIACRVLEKHLQGRE